MHGAALRCRAGAGREPCSSAHISLPIWSCSVWGLPCLRRYRRSGALLPHLFTLTTDWPSRRKPFGPTAAPKRAQPRRYVFCGTGRPRALKPASRTLSGTLPCGVRTFLPRQHGSPCLRQRPPGPPASLKFTRRLPLGVCYQQVSIDKASSTLHIELDRYDRNGSDLALSSPF